MGTSLTDQPLTGTVAREQISARNQHYQKYLRVAAFLGKSERKKCKSLQHG
jgi:hypothetical protein